MKRSVQRSIRVLEGGVGPATTLPDRKATRGIGATDDGPFTKCKGTSTKHYIIRGRIEGKRRLEVLARTMWPATRHALERAGLTRSMKCLDLGCGGGDVTVALGRIVGPEGRAIGVDFDEVKLGFARESAEQLGLSNVEFRQLDVQRWDEDADYDFIYCRFLLTHLKDPAGALRQMHRAARSGGVVLVEDIDFAGSIWHPPCKAMETYARLYQTAAARRGCDANIGPKLYLLLRDAGWQDLHLHVVQPTFFAGEGKQIALLTLVNIAETILAEELATQAELDRTIAELASYTEDPRTLISLPRVFQVWGRRAGPRDRNAAARAPALPPEPNTIEAIA